jgi:hypothetical protein
VRAAAAPRPISPCCIAAARKGNVAAAPRSSCTRSCSSFASVARRARSGTWSSPCAPTPAAQEPW